MTSDLSTAESVDTFNQADWGRADRSIGLGQGRSGRFLIGMMLAVCFIELWPEVHFTCAEWRSFGILQKGAFRTATAPLEKVFE